MKKLFILFAFALAACQPVAYENYQGHRHSIKGNPRYSVNDTVKNTRSHRYNVYIIDTPKWSYLKAQWFYTAHTPKGVKVDWLPENSIHQ